MQGLLSLLSQMPACNNQVSESLHPACRSSTRCSPIYPKTPINVRKSSQSKTPPNPLLPFGALTVPLARVWCTRYILLQRQR